MLIYQQKFPLAVMKKYCVTNHQNPIMEEGSEKVITENVFVTQTKSDKS